VRDPTVHAAAVRDVVEAFEALGFGAVDVTRSPVAGRRAGNVEYPLRLLRGVETTLDAERILTVAGVGRP
jgi:predicted rRNA methylase YqxC with S4 and FtsJ domains